MNEPIITTLPNGLRIITDHVPSVETVAVGVWIGVGARNENLIHNGTAHMVEHMLFKGTKKRDALQIVEEIENVGGHMNAYTARELTSYHIHLLKDDLSLALDILADMVQNSNMPDEEIERERDVILQEIGMCHDTPDDIIFDRYYETAYPNQAVGAPILGTVDIIKNMKRETLMDFVKNKYTPENMIISASGNIDHDTFIAQVEDAFKDLPANTNLPLDKAKYQGGNFRENRDLEQSHVILGFQAPSRISKDFYATQTLSTLMGGGMSSRLFQEIREKRGLVYSVYSFTNAYQDNGQFGIYAGTGPERLPELIPVMCEEILKSKNSITDTEVQRAKSQIRSSVLMARESMMKRADQNARDLLQRGEIRTADTIIEGIKNVTKEQLETVATEIFATAPTLAALGPLDQLEPIDMIKKRLVS